jgi:hypothetical protein
MNKIRTAQLHMKRAISRIRAEHGQETAEERNVSLLHAV